MDGWLEVGLLSVDHHPHVLLLGVLEDGVEPVDHVPELLLLEGGQRPRVVPGDELLHLAGVQVGDLQRSSCHQVITLSLSSPGTCPPDPSWC